MGLPSPALDCQAGARQYCGNSFPDGMRKNDRLAQVRRPVHHGTAGSSCGRAAEVMPLR